MGISNQLRAFDGGFATVASFPTLKDKPIVAGESDPDGCAACTGNQLGYRTTTMFSSYTADCVAHEYELADRDGVNFAGAVNWSFEMEGQAPFAGFRTMATDGIDLPVLNALRMFGKMSGQRVAVQSSAGLKLADILRAGVRDNPDISSIASIDGKKLAVMVWYYHDDDLPGPDANVSLTVNGLPQDVAQARLQHFRVDSQHSDATTVWQQMGSPKDITPEQHAQLEKAGQLAMMDGPATVDLKNGHATLKFNLPRQGVSLLVLNWD
jgi:xylan 1,4-beta-xylosidase